jgi:DNA repair exonuclease SbcCD ATPase subunit
MNLNRFFGRQQEVPVAAAAVVSNETFESIIDGLRQAIQAAKERNVGNQKFHTEEVLPALTDINNQIDEIIRKITAYKQRLQGMEGEIGANREKLAEMEGLRAQLLEKDRIISQKESDAQAQLERNQAELRTLTEQSRAGEQVFQEQMANLRNTLNREKQEIANTRDANARQQLEQQQAATLQQIDALQGTHANEKSAIQQEIDQHKATNSQLKSQLDNLERDNAENMNRLAAAGQETEKVLRENQELTGKLEAAKVVMKEAIDALNSLENYTSVEQIRQVIRSITTKIGQINNILDLNARNNGPGEEEFFEASEGLPDNTPITYTYTIGGVFSQRNIEKTFTYGEIKNGFSKAQVKANKKQIFNTIKQRLNDASSVQGVISVLDSMSEPNIDLKNVLNSILESIRSRGGKKTRRGKNTCKGGKKTKRKQRKQKGGYHYSERSKRRSLTTTSSSRRSKRRTKRTTRG